MSQMPQRLQWNMRHSQTTIFLLWSVYQNALSMSEEYHKADFRIYIMAWYDGVSGVFLKWSHHRRNDTGRRRVGLLSVTLNSCRQTTGAPHCYYWPDGQTETLFRKIEMDIKWELVWGAKAIVETKVRYWYSSGAKQGVLFLCKCRM